MLDRIELRLCDTGSCALWCLQVPCLVVVPGSFRFSILRARHHRSSSVLFNIDVFCTTFRLTSGAAPVPLRARKETAHGRL